jgi:methylated-DNA-[protein]-cysteine S-methyltransferase
MHRSVAAPVQVATATLDTQIGMLSIAVSDAGLLAVGWDQPEHLAQRLGVNVGGDQARADPVRTELSDYFAGRRRSFELPLDWTLSTPAQRAVLGTLFATVGFGESITYGELAARSGTGIPARGIGAVMGGNPLPIVVPCHRVLAAGGLGGYSGGFRAATDEPEGGPGSSRYGLETKRWLLTFEGVLPPTLGWDPDAVLVIPT